MTEVRLTKPWRELDDAAIAALPGQLGVFEIGDAEGGTLELGFAGGRSRFGLRSAVAETAAKHEGAARFRYEVNMQYWSRFEELLAVYFADHGRLPPGNADRGELRVGRLGVGRIAATRTPANFRPTIASGWWR